MKCGFWGMKNKNAPFLVLISNNTRDDRAFIVLRAKQKAPPKKCFAWRRHPDLNWGIGVLQTRALPLGYGAEYECEPKLTM